MCIWLNGKVLKICTFPITNYIISNISNPNPNILQLYNLDLKINIELHYLSQAQHFLFGKKSQTSKCCNKVLHCWKKGITISVRTLFSSHFWLSCEINSRLTKGWALMLTSTKLWNCVYVTIMQHFLQHWPSRLKKSRFFLSHFASCNDVHLNEQFK